MKLLIGVFEMIIGVLIILITIKLVHKHEANDTITVSTMIKLAVVAIFAGFTKGFFGAGWGPIGIGMSVLLGINPRIVVGSSLVIRLLLDITGGVTYAMMNLIDANVVIVLVISGCIASLLAVKLTKIISEKSLRIFLGTMITILGALVIIEA